jgi:hypothetical protein
VATGTLIYEAMAADRLLGRLAAVMDEPNLAINHFETSLTFCRNSGCEPEFAWTCFDLATVLNERSQQGDRERAATLRETALGIAAKVGMQPPVWRVHARG